MTIDGFEEFSPKLFNLLFANTTEQVWIVDAEYCVLFLNKACFQTDEKEERLGVIIGKSIFTEENPLSYVEFWKKNYKRCFQGEAFTVAEQLNGLKDLSSTYSLSPLKDSKDRVVGAMVIKYPDVKKNRRNFVESKNHTREEMYEEMQANKEERESNEYLLAKIAENYPNSFVSVIEKDLTIGFSGGQGFKQQNLNPNDFVGLTLEQVFGEETPFIKGYYMRTFAGEETTFELFINNQHQLYKTAPIYDENKKIRQILVVTENISDRKIVEQELIEAKKIAEENETRFKALHNASFGGIAIHDKGVILDCNQGLSDLTGFAVDELIGMDGLLLIASIERKQVMANIQSGYEKPYETVGLRKNGSEYPVRLEARNIPYKGKQVRVVEFRDITKRKEAEAEILRAKEKAEESDRLKSIFLKNISHEVRTPMNAIVGFSDMLISDDYDSTAKEDFAKALQQSTRKLLDVIESILMIAHIESGQLKLLTIDFFVNDLLDSLLSEIKQKQKENNKETILISIQPTTVSSVKLNADYTQIYRMMSVLLDNALKFTTHGRIEFGYVETEDAIELIVKDSGVGFPQKEKKQIFKAFSQANDQVRILFGGIGLGLSICAGLARMMNGSIHINSEAGKGTEIKVLLPKTLIVQNNSSKIKEETLSVESVKTLLVAEDEVFNFMLIEKILAKSGLTLYHAENGREAIDLFKQKSIDLILMDLKMPIMNGFDATMAIREFDKTVPIIAQTAFSYKREECMQAGFTDYLSKPFNKEQLLKVVNKYLEK